MIDKFAEYLQIKDKSSHTVKNYMSDIKQFEKWFIDATGDKLENATEIDIKEYKSFLTNVKKLKLSSIKRKIESIRKFYDWAQMQGFVKQNPVKEIQIPTYIKSPPKSLSDNTNVALIKNSFVKHKTAKKTKEN